VDDGAAVKGYGQDAKERAFVSIAVDGEKIWSRRFDVIAVTTDGGEVTSSSRPFGGTAKAAGGVVKFEFDLPLAKVAKFRIGSRAIRTRQWTDVVMTESKQNLYGDMRQTPPAKSQSSSLSQPESTPGVPLLIQGRSIADWVKEAEISVRPGKEGERALRVLENAGPPIMPQLGRLLVEDKSPEIQAKAAWAMSVISYHNPDAPEVHSAVPVLTTAAQNKSSEVRIYSVQALGAIGRAASNAVPVLIRSARDENDGVRLSAVDALGRIGATLPESIEALTAAVSDGSSDVRITARKALEMLVLPRLRQPLPEATAVNAFRAIGPSAVPSLIALLKDGDPVLRADAAWALGSLQISNRQDLVAISPLIGALGDPDAHVRLQAAAALGQFGPAASAAVEPLTGRLKDDEKGPDTNTVVYVRAAAARALGRIGPGAKAAVPMLQSLSTDQNRYTRMDAVVALWRIQRLAAAALPKLMDGLSTIEQDTTWQIFDALAEMGPQAKEAVPAISAHLNSPNPLVRKRAAEALRHIETGPASQMSDLQTLVQAILTGDSTGLEKEGLGFKFQTENSQEMLDFSKQQIRWQAATALTKRGTNAWPVVPALLSTVSGKDMSVGHAAAEALVGIKAEESPEWARSRQLLVGQTNAARVFRYLLVGRDMFGRTYDGAHRRFGLVGLAATGPAAGIAYPDIVDVLKHDKELEVRACAAMVLGSLEVERKATVVLLKGVLQDKGIFGDFSGWVGAEREKAFRVKAVGTA
jgi:HEAT repeat protein